MLITLDIKTAIAAFTLIPAGILIGFWFISELLHRPLRFRLEKRFLWQCDICTYVYINIKDSIFSICPRCGSYNKRKESKEQELDNKNTKNSDRKECEDL